MKLVLKLVLVASLLLNGFYLLRSIPIRTGGGTYKTSPDATLVAHAQSYVNANPLAKNNDVVSGDLEIHVFHNQTGREMLISLAVRPPGVDSEMGYRQLDDPISWSSDSRTATFTLPHAVVSVTPIWTVSDVPSSLR